MWQFIAIIGIGISAVGDLAEPTVSAVLPHFGTRGNIPLAAAIN
ncbi:hypothetical protein ACNKHX_00575 [Shigella flexneri]